MRFFTVSLILYTQYCETQETIEEHTNVAAPQIDHYVHILLFHPQYQQGKTGIHIDEQEKEV